MKKEFADEKLTGILDKLTGALPAQVEERAMREMANARPVRARSRRRLIALAVGAAVVVFALGFVPFPAGSAKGALTRAMAAMEQGGNVHILAKGAGEMDGYEIELWESTNGLWRFETRKDGSVKKLELMNREKSLTYIASSHYAHEFDIPPRVPEDKAVVGHMTGDSKFAANHLKRIKQIAKSISEERERSLWGEKRDVITAEITIKTKANPVEMPIALGLFGYQLGHSHGDYRDPGTIRVKLVIDHASGRLLSEEEFRKQGDSWEQTASMKVEWDGDFPPSLHDFKFPKGTTLRREVTFRGRTERILAKTEVDGWIVRLHDLERDKHGNLSAVISHSGSGKRIGDARGWSLRIEARDNCGVKYEALSFRNWPFYYVFPLMREKTDVPLERAKTIKLTIFGKIIFSNLPLPPLSDKDKLFQDEVIQY
jgi:hypothetical protein